MAFLLSGGICVMLGFLCFYAIFKDGIEGSLLDTYFSSNLILRKVAPTLAILGIILVGFGLKAVIFAPDEPEEEIVSEEDIEAKKKAAEETKKKNNSMAEDYAAWQQKSKEMIKQLVAAYKTFMSENDGKRPYSLDQLGVSLDVGTYSSLKNYQWTFIIPSNISHLSPLTAPILYSNLSIERMKEDYKTAVTTGGAINIVDDKNLRFELSKDYPKWAEYVQSNKINPSNQAFQEFKKSLK